MASAQQASLPLSDKQVANVELDKLELDPANPRFGDTNGKPKTQVEILDTIVLDYGIEDVISSLAVNGYFPAEPIICVKKKATGKYVVVEGNRRLAASLVLAGDARAKNHTKRTNSYQKMQAEHGQPAITAIPVIWFDEGESPKELISYLGVRHLAASMPWDSYAKAAWIAEVVKDGQLSMEDISMMTGDQNKTIARLLHGYYVIGQLAQTGHFNPDACIKKGRGSNAEFAFSWVYTLLGYPSSRARLGIADDPRPNPIPAEKLNDAGIIFTRLLGNREDRSSMGRPAIDDSRQLGQYAAALVDDRYFKLLRQGYTLDEIEEELQPANERLAEGLDDAEKLLGELVTLVSKTPPSNSDAAELLPQVVKLANLTSTLQHALIAALAAKPVE